MNNNLTPLKEVSEKISPYVGEFRNLISNFWGMLDFPRHLGQNTADPKFDVKDGKNALTVTAVLPGIEEKDIDIQILPDGYLTISGEMTLEKKEEKKNSSFSSIHYGSFSRQIPLPFNLDYDKTEAKFSDGVLEISIPKKQTEQQNVKKIAVKKNKKA